jgi:Flp pilus assembly protein TadG
VEAAHSVRDVFAILGSAADAQVQVQVNVNSAVYCTLTFAPGTIASNSILGSTLPPLQAMAQVTVAVLSVGQTYPGADLTVIIRL